MRPIPLQCMLNLQVGCRSLHGLIPIFYTWVHSKSRTLSKLSATLLTTDLNAPQPLSLQVTFKLIVRTSKGESLDSKDTTDFQKIYIYVG